MKKNYVIMKIKISLNMLNRRLEPDAKRIVSLKIGLKKLP